MKKKKYHIIYKIINTVNNKYYIGMHSTHNLNDGYLGSGKVISYSIDKYGENNHKVEHLEFLPNRKTLIDREKEIINEKLIRDPLCMNLQIGGGGGFSGKNHQKKCSDAGRKAYKKKLENKDYKKFISETIYKSNKENPRGFVLNQIDWTGKTHTEETKAKIGKTNSEIQSGKGNSQYGTCWVCNKDGAKKIKKEELSKYEELGWAKGRKIK